MRDRNIWIVCSLLVLLTSCKSEPPQFVDFKPENNETVAVKEIAVRGKVLQKGEPAGSATVEISIVRTEGEELIFRKHLKTNSQGLFMSTVPLYKKKMDASGKINTDVFSGQYKISLSTDVGGAKGQENIYIDVKGKEPVAVAQAPVAPASPPPATTGGGVTSPPPAPTPPKPAAPDWGTVERAGDQLAAQKRYVAALTEWQKIPQGQGSSQLPGKISDAQARAQYAPVEQAGDNLNASGQYDEAIGKWESIPETYQPKDKIAEAKRLIGERLAKHREIEAQGDQKLASGNAQGAYDTWTKIPEQYRSPDLKNKMGEALKKVADGADRAKWADVESRADRLMTARDYRSALQKYETVPAKYASPDLGNKQMEAMEGAQWQGVLDEGNAEFAKKEYGAALAKWESVPAKFQPEGLPEKVQEGQTWLKAQELETAGDAAGTLGNWETALASYNAVPKGYESPALAAKIPTAEEHVKWLGSEKQADALWDEVAERGKKVNLEKALSAYRAIPQGFGSGGLADKVGKVQKLVDEFEGGNPFVEGKGLADQGDYVGAIQKFEAVDPSSGDYINAQWNVALISMGEESVKNIDRSIQALETIAEKDNNVYAYYYQGIARYQKARSYQDVLDSKVALDDYKKALDLFDEAGARADGFGRLRIEGVPSLPPEENITLLDYYGGATYFFLHQFGKYDPLIPEETLNGYKLNARNKLGQYLRRAGRIKTESVRQFVTEAQNFMKQLRQE